MSKWAPITDLEFAELFRQQYAELDELQRESFERFRIPFFKATLRRTDAAGDEKVFVVSQKGDGILYFDDVEYGFNIATIDANGNILTPGGSQKTLKEAVEDWFP